MEFPGMTMKELSPAGDLQEQPISVKDVDKFFTQLYNYFAQKGLGVIVLTELCSVLSLGFTVSFTTFLMGVVNWSVLSECFDENTCRKVEEELFLNPFHQEPSAYKFIITIYFLLFFSYWVYACHSSVQRVLAAWEMETFYCDHLKIPFNSISDVEWYQVLEKFIDLYDKDQLPFILFPSQKEDTVTSPSDHYHTPLLSTEGQQNQINHKPELTIQQIVCRIMRKENYFIALINKHQLDLYLPWWLSPYTTEQLVLTKTMEWSLYFCLFDEMFVMNNEGNYIIRESFFSDVNGLQHRFQMIGLIMFLLIPFMTIFMILHFFLENASYFHSTKAYLGPRQWTPFALWQFREFNELKHFFDERMNAAYIPATEYLLCFRNPYIIVLARLVSYIAGGIVATILFVSIFHSEALVHITVSEHNLLWYLGISSALFATSRSMLPDETKKSELPAVLLEKMRCHTHQDGLNWLGKEHTTVVRNEISDLLVFKIQFFLTEISGVWLTPLILCFSLPRCVPTLLEFLRTHSEYKEHIGTVCDYCSFDIAKHGDPTYGSITETDRENAPTRMQDNHSSGIPNNGAPSQIRSAAPSSTANNINKIRLNDGKLEKSVVSFMHHYPTAQLDPRALTFLDRMDTYKSMMKTRREREVSSMIFEKSIFPVGTGSVGRASVTLNSEAGDRDRVILPPAPSHSTEEIIHEKDNVHGIAMTSPPALAFPAVGEDKSFGNSSPVRDLVSSDYYPYEDSATFNNTKANRGLINTQPPSIPPPPYAGQKVSNEKLPVIREQIISRDEMGIGEGNGAVGMSGGQAGVSILKSPNYSHYPRSRMILSSRGQTPQRNPSSSLFGVGSRFHRQQIGRGREQNSEEMPSVLLSLLQRQNIDYQNDFYWLEKFHRDKVLHKEELDKSLLDYQLQQQNISQLHSQQNSFFPFAMPGGSTSRWPSSFPHEPIPPPSLNQAFDHNSTAGMYAENINRNIISSPKPSAAYRKSANSGNSLKSTSNPQMLGAAANSSGSGDNIATVTSGGGYFPFETSRVNSVDENDQSFSPVVQEHYTNSLTPQKPTHGQSKDT